MNKPLIAASCIVIFGAGWCLGRALHASPGKRAVGVELDAGNQTTQLVSNQDIVARGRNPWLDLRDYGGYAGAGPTTSGTITFGSPTLHLSSALDFVNGQGILIYGAGPFTTLTPPGKPTIAPVNVTGDSTAYSYKVIAEDRMGGLTAASLSGTTTTGVEKLGAYTVSPTQCSRRNGVSTYTTTSNHKLTIGTQIRIFGFGTVFDFCNGVKTIDSVPSSTTFTTNDGQAANEIIRASTATATAYACNRLTFPTGSYSGAKTLRYWIYRSINGSVYSLVGVAQGADPWWMDCGRPAPTAPSYIPSSPPGTKQPGYLATTISSGARTTTITIAKAASTTAINTFIEHDNSVPLLNAAQATMNSGGGTVFIPPFGLYGAWIFNGTTDFSSLNNLNNALRIHFDCAVILNNPFILLGNMDFEGEPHSLMSFGYVPGTSIGGTAYPLFFTNNTAVHMNRLQLSANNSQQTAFYSDEISNGAGPAGLVFDDVDFGGGTDSTPVVLKGGFDYFFTRGTCNGGSFLTGCVMLSNSSTAVTGGGLGLMPGRVVMKQFYFQGKGTVIDCSPNEQLVSATDYVFDSLLYESATQPFLRLNCPRGQFNNVQLNDVVGADSAIGFGGPFIDSENASIIDVVVNGGSLTNGNQPALIVGSENKTGNLNLNNAPFYNPGNVPYSSSSGGFLSSTLSISSARLAYPLSSPDAPSVAVGRGGSVPLGTHRYQLQWLDIDGNNTVLSSATTANVTTGNQTVTVTEPKPPVGAVAWVPYRDGAKVQMASCGTASIPTSTRTYVDVAGFTCGEIPPRPSLAAQSLISQNGISTYQYRLAGNGLASTWTSGLGAPSSRTCTSANPGSLYSRLDGDVNTTLYVCDAKTHTWTPK
jgi:hypothetical protein